MNGANGREIKDVFYLVALQGVNYVMPLIVFPYLMVVLGAEKFGYIGFSMSITQYLMIIVDFGFNFSATKQIALNRDNPEKLRGIFWSTIVAKIGLLVACFLVTLVIAFAVPRFEVYRSTMLVLFLMVVGNTFSFVWFFQGLGRIRVVSIVNLISKILIFPLVFFLVKKPDDYLIAAFTQSAVYIFSACLICVILICTHGLPRWKRPEWSEIVSGVKSAFPIFLSSAASSFYFALFAVILGFFSTPEEVGRYTAAEKIMRGFCFLVFIPVSQAFFPKISALSGREPDTAKKLIRKIIIFIGLVMGVVFVLLFFFSDYIMQFLGKGYDGIGTIFKIMAIIPFFVALGGIAGQLGLLALGNDHDKKNYKRTYFIAAAVAFVFIFALVPGFYSIGASVALLITEFTVFILMFWYGRHNIFSK